MRRSTLAGALSALLMFGAAGAVAAADKAPAKAVEKTAAGALSRGLTQVCDPWRAGAERKALEASLKAGGWDLLVVPSLEGPWGSALFKMAQAGPKRGCSAFVTLTREGETEAATKAALAWVARAYPKTPMTNQNKPIQLETGPVHAWTWVDETTTITFYTADKVVGVAGPHVVLSIQPR